MSKIRKLDFSSLVNGRLSTLNLGDFVKLLRSIINGSPATIRK